MIFLTNNIEISRVCPRHQHRKVVSLRSTVAKVNDAQIAWDIKMMVEVMVSYNYKGRAETFSIFCLSNSAIHIYKRQ